MSAALSPQPTGLLLQATNPEHQAIQSFQYTLLKLLLRFLALMPLPFLHGIARCWGRLAMLLSSRAKATTETNLRLCFPELSDKEITELTLRSLQHTSCTAMEMGKSWVWPFHKTLGLVHTTKGYDGFQEACKSGDGVILMAPHLSNWEIFGYYACEGVDSHFMYQPPKIAAVDQLLKETRSRSGVQLAPTSSRGVAQLLKALRRGDLVGILPDQVPAPEGGEYAEFFGHTAFTMTLVSKLLQRTNAKVFCGFARRLEWGRGFEVVIEEADPAIYSTSIEESVQALNHSVESLVKLAPSQYQWEYKRFRRLPGGLNVYRG